MFSLFMNIISWNVRGLGRPAKRFLVKDFLLLHCAEVCCLQESKLADFPNAIWREVGGSKFDDFAFVPARGSAGGMVIGWNSSILTGSVLFIGGFCLTVEFHDKRDHSQWRCTSVYGPNARHLKPAFWEEIRRSGGGGGLPWVICGDFNAIFSVNDKNSGIPCLDDIHHACGLLNDLSLYEPPAVGRRFSWTNGHSDPSWVKLDRFLINSDWGLRFPRVIQTSLPRLGSDHVPIRLEVGTHVSNPRPFRFELAWCSADGFHDLIQL